MIDIDDIEAIERLDSQGVLGAIEAFADQCARGWELGIGARGLPSADGLEHVVVLGVGGSGFAGDIVRTIVEPRLPLPLRVIKGYAPLPEWVGRNTLVLAASYSGNTEETLDAFAAAHERGARLVAVASGGDLADAAAAHDGALVAVPPGGQPRASLGYLALPLLAVLVRMEIVPDVRPDVDELLGVVGDVAAAGNRRVRLADNPAKQLARIVAGRIPVFYGGSGVGSAPAYRAKCDVNEYAKQPAFSNEIPEMGHNEIVGWNRLAGVTSKEFTALFLRDPGEDRRVAARMDVTRRLVRGYVADALEVWAEGESPAARVFHLVTLTQLAAIYAALLNGVDPGPVEAIDRLKAEMAKTDEQGASS